MSRAAAKVGAKDMATLRTSLPFRCVSVLFFVGAAFLFGGAAFSSGAVQFPPPLGPTASIAGTTTLNDMIVPPEEAPVFQQVRVVGRHGTALRQLDERMLTELAVSNAV